MESRSISGVNYVPAALERFSRYGDREALVGGGQRLTYTQVHASVLAVAGVLRDNGIGAGMNVAVLVGHPPQAPILQFALHLVGCRTVWIKSSEPRPNIESYLRAIPPDAFVYDARSPDPLAVELATTLAVPVLCLGQGLGVDLLDTSGEPYDPAWVAGTPESVFQTSGTTGGPKLTHHGPGFFRQVLELAEQVAAQPPVWRHLSLSVLGHVSGQISALLYLFAGGLLVLLEDYDPAEFLATIERERINSTFISPPDFYQLLDHPALLTADVSSMRMLSIGAGPASPARLRQGLARFGEVLRITYGLSECPFVAANMLVDDPSRPQLLASCGQPYGDVEVQVRDEHGTAVGPGEVGELWVASRLTFVGYWGDPVATARTLRDGWLRTNDLGYRDEQGYLYLVGRAQDMIITGQVCEKVYPRPVEDALASHPLVRAAAVIGVPDPAFGEIVHAFVVPIPGASIRDAELVARVLEQLPEGWEPRSFEYVDALPVNGTGKVDKKALRARRPVGRATIDVGSPE